MIALGLWLIVAGVWALVLGLDTLILAAIVFGALYWIGGWQERRQGRRQQALEEDWYYEHPEENETLAEWTERHRVDL